MKRLILSRGVDVQDARHHGRLVGHDPDGEAVEAREADHGVGREGRVDLEEAVAVEDEVQDLADVVRLRLVLAG